MDRFKYFYEKYKKEVMIGIVLIIAAISGVGIYLFFRTDQPKEDLLSNVQELEEQSEPIEKQKENLEELRIDIKGEVQHPGVYIANRNMRVIDIIQLAGGLTKNADTSVNNLSKKVVDEMVIKIYSKREVKDFTETKEKEDDLLKRSQTIIEDLQNEGALKKEELLPNHSTTPKKEQVEESNDSNSKKISINTATKEELLSLTGIGESKAVAIITYREEHGKFKNIEEIMLVSGIGESVFEKIKDFITI